MSKASNPASPSAPPQGFAPVPSQVDGITVYAPAPEEKPAEQTRSFKCPTCGGVTAYSATEKSLTCAHCGKTQQIDAETVGWQAAQFEFTLETMEQAQYGWGETRREVACAACGSVVTVAPAALTSTCAFCGSNRVLAREATGELLRPTALIPFTVDQQRCQAQVAEWLGQGWMHPPELRHIRALQKLAGVYLPFWIFDTDICADWKAEVGTKRTERYYSDGEWKTRTVIDWDWRTGRVHLPIRNHLVPGTVRVSRVLLRRAEPFSLTDLVTYEPGYLAGWQAKNYDVMLQQAWETAKEEMRAESKDACYEDTGSSHVRNFRMVADFSDERWRHILLPIYVASYPFEDRTYQVVVNGQTGEVAGQKPVAWLRVWLAIAALLLPGSCLGLLGLLLVPLGGIGIVGLAIGGILFIAGLVGAFIIFQKARESEQI